jgi:hypothetical protein
MAPRKRKIENRHLPMGLIRKTVRGVKRFRYRFPSGKDVYFPPGTIEIDAIEAAETFNRKHRNPTINMLIEHDEFNKPLSQWLAEVDKRVIAEELKRGIISEKVYKAFSADLTRLKELHGSVLSKDITLTHVNEFLNAYTLGKSNEVYNRKITFLKKIFSYLCDMSAMATNPAMQKKRKPKEDKVRKRLNLENFNTILNSAPHWLQIAMRLSIQTTHSVNEISNAKYKDCEWYPSPVIENGLTVYGVLRIHRQKVKNKEASRVAIPITQALKQVINDSRADNIVSPFIVHAFIKRKKGMAAGLKHFTQLHNNFISRHFSDLRDELALFNDLDKSQRPTFHEIRALSIFLYGESGIDPQARAAHTDSASTKVYLKDHIQWVEIQAAELSI